MNERFPSLYVVVDHQTVRSRGWSLDGYVRQLAESGARFFQYRAKDQTASIQLETLCTLREIVHAYGGSIVVNDRADVAVAAEADGVHLPGDGLSVTAARDLIGDGLVGCSTHELDELGDAARAGADFVTYSPVWSPLSKEDDRSTHGRAGLSEAVQHLRQMEAETQLYALGGVTPDRAEICFDLGVGAASLGGVLERGSAEAFIRR